MFVEGPNGEKDYLLQNMNRVKLNMLAGWDYVWKLSYPSQTGHPIEHESQHLAVNENSEVVVMETVNGEASTNWVTSPKEDIVNAVAFNRDLGFGKYEKFLEPFATDEMKEINRGHYDVPSGEFFTIRTPTPDNCKLV